MIAFLTSARRVYVALVPSVNCYAGKNLGTGVWDGKQRNRLPPRVRSAILKSSRKRELKLPCSNAGPTGGAPRLAPAGPGLLHEAEPACSFLSMGEQESRQWPEKDRPIERPCHPMSTALLVVTSRAGSTALKGSGIK